MARIIKFPFGASEAITPAYAAAIAVDVADTKTILTPATLTGNMTINLSIDSEVVAGSELIVIATADSSERTVTFGTGFSAGTDNLVIGGTLTKTASFIFNGTSFTEKSEPTGIDSAAVSLNSTHRTSDGKNHADVVLNNSHRTGNGSDHANVSTNTTNIANLTNGTTVRTGRIQNSATAGTPEAGVTAVNYGDGTNIVTVLTVTDLDLGTVAAGGNFATGALAYTFPAGVHALEVTNVNLGVIGDLAVQADTPEIGIGSVVASGAVGVLNGTAEFMDYVTEQTMADVNGTPTVGLFLPTAGALSGIALNEAGDVKALNINIADNWAGASAALLCSGTITLKWSKIA